jgi:hypothetical protein
LALDKREANLPSSADRIVKAMLSCTVSAPICAGRQGSGPSILHTAMHFPTVMIQIDDIVEPQALTPRAAASGFFSAGVDRPLGQKLVAPRH